jgi:S-layer family protein
MGHWQHALLKGATDRSLAGPRRPRRRLIVACVAAVMLAIPVAVNASHIFSDVSTSNTFHAAISTLYGARITGGCGGGKYCPNDPVTRGSMAAFLVRGLGRMATTDDFADDDWAALTQAPPAPGEDHPFGLVSPTEFRHGGGSGGTAHVFATGTVNAWTDEAGVCPCEVQVFLINVDTDEKSGTVFGMIGSEFAPLDPDLVNHPTLPNVAYSETTVTVSFGFTVDSGVINNYGIAARIVPTTAPTDTPADAFHSGWSSTLQTVYVPFSADGTNPVTTTTQGKHPRGSRTH